jgi:RimJ/RimL family protein N-acetyltransferase
MDDVDIGYSILDRYAGNGYTYEAAVAVMEHGRTVHGLKRIVGFTAPDNVRSIRLLERLGLRFERMLQLPNFEGPSKLFG